ncbi:MAG: protein kinase [Lentisphaerales bacterium]|nr:protein kinase [Lentisphaerales bacterium]
MSEFGELGNFCEDNDEDNWESGESVVSISSERYKDREFIAAGGLKKVYKVFDTKMERFIALAELKEDIPEEQCEVFLKEASMTASLRHPNIITAYDFGVSENHLPYMTMELKVGDTLADILKKKEMVLEELLNIFTKICDAVSYAHSKSVIHLDLKPENIQVGEFGEVQVCDWGLSQKITEKTVVKSVHGTPGYMSPEQLIVGASLDTRSDIYALGAILYSLLTYERPIEGSLNSVIDSTSAGKIKPPSLRFPDQQISKSLDAVTCRAMSFDASERYQSVIDLKNEVYQFLGGHSTDAENAGLIKELQLFYNRNKQLCMVTVVAAALIILATTLFMYQLQRSKKSTEDALTDLSAAHKELKIAQQKERLLFKEKEEAKQQTFTARQEKQKMYAKLLDRDLKKAYDLMSSPLYFASPHKSSTEALKILKAQYKATKGQRGLRNLLAISLFVTQSYEEFSNFEGHNYKSLIPIAQKYKDTPKNDFGVLNENDFVKLLEDVNNIPKDDWEVKIAVFERSICYMVDARKPVFTSHRIVMQLLKCWNPDWDTKNLVYDVKSLTLKLKGKELRKLYATAGHSSGLCFLRFIKIDLLDLRGTGVGHMSHLKGSNIRKLDIRDTKVKHLHPHGATKNIQEVYLTPGQFVGYEALFTPQSVKLIYK